MLLLNTQSSYHSQKYTRADDQSITEADFPEDQGQSGNSNGYPYGQDQGYGNGYGNGGYA